eukprot:jgi/Mesen1/6896/ME000353S05921
MADQEDYAHPKVALFHVLFKSLAIAFYIVGGFVTDSFIINFVICMIFLALDFWTVKNVSGRILVGLRWWSETDDNGENVWKFESLDQQALDRLNKKDSWLFWWTLYLVPAVWLALGVVTLVRLSFDYLLIVGVALVLGGANIIGFTKCRRDARKQIQQFAQQTVAAHMASTLQTAFAV